MMSIDEFMRAVERAWDQALPGHQATERDAVLRAVRRSLEARDHVPADAHHRSKVPARGPLIRRTLP
jgi:hypothetical protein